MAKQAELEELLAEVIELRAQIAECRREFEARKIPDDVVDKLLRLCHPDKHFNSQLSCIATAWLLEIRRNRKTLIT